MTGKSITKENLKLPTLTKKVIQRATEGLNIAKDTAVKSAMEKSQQRLQEITKTDRRKIKIASTMRRFITRIIIKSAFDIKVEYPERIPHEPVIIAPNHLHHIDPFIILSEVPALPYYYIIGDWRSLYDKWWKRPVINFFEGVIPVERLWKEEMAVMESAKNGNEELKDLAKEIEENIKSTNNLQALRQMDTAVQNILARGDGLILFPEGRLGETEGNLHLPFKRGTAIYALRSGVPIIPVAIIGTKNLSFRKELIIRFGKPILNSQSKRPKKKEIEAVLNQLEESLVELLS